MPLLELAGAPALTPARLAKRLRRVQAAEPGRRRPWRPSSSTSSSSSGRSPRRPGEPWSGCSSTGRAAAPGGSGPAGPPQEARRLWVVPRLGTISPWSTKATDIAHICGLWRRGRAASSAASAYGVVRRGRRRGGAAARPLHDRMTESVLDRAEDAARLFAPGGAAAAPDGGRRWPRGGRRWSRPTAELGLALSPDEIDYLVESFAGAGPRPHRRRADDVRPGQQRALPAQDLQRRAHPRRREAAAARCSR